MAFPDTQFESSGHTVKISGLHDGEYIFGLIKQEHQFYEFDLLDFVRRLPLGKGSAIDVGANLGNHTVFFSLVMQRPTHAFEISAKNLAVLRQNVEANGLTDLVTIHEYGLHSETATCSILENFENMGQTRVVPLDGDAQTTVELKRLDDVVSAGEPVAILKIDVEGGELGVLKGAGATLDRDHPLCLIEGHPGPAFDDLALFFADHDYQPVHILGRSDNWIFAHSEKLGFLLPYIEANVARSQTRSVAGNESRIRTLQGRLEYLRTDLAAKVESNSSATRTEIAGLTAKSEELVGQIEALAQSSHAQIETLGTTTGQAINQMSARIRELSADLQKHSKTTQTQMAKVTKMLDSLVRRSVRRWTKDTIKLVARGLARNRVSKKLILVFVPRSIRKKAADRILGGSGRRQKALTTTSEPPPSEHVPENPFTDSVSFQSVLICGAYPGGKRTYGGEFIRTRVNEYAARGHSVLVVETSARNFEPALERVSGVDILRIIPAHLGFFLRFLEPRVASFLTHSPSPETMTALKEIIGPERQFHWFHGYDIRDYRRLYFNYSTGELARQKLRLDALNHERVAVIGPCMSDPRPTKIFVSEYLKNVAEIDMDQAANNFHVIPNFIDGSFFEFSQKTAEQARRMLLIRAFSARNYANDIAIDAISLLRNRSGFEDIQFTIRGFGDLFGITDQIADLPNVDVEEGHLLPSEIVALHATHGVFLCPSRFDTQGVSMGEAMASGLVCITNPVTAIPEYTDSECSILVRPDDPVAYANAIWDIYLHPERVPQLSKTSAERVRNQCGVEQTIERELIILAAQASAVTGSSASV